MPGFDWVHIIVFTAIFVSLTPLFGTYMAAIFQGKKTFAHRPFAWLERFTYRLAGIRAEEEMHWKVYLKALLLFNLFGFITLFGLQMGQQFLPLNPQNFSSVPWPLAFNTAVSFATNTNWQSYAGETTLSYAVQMLGLTVQNFLSAATGVAVLLALTRGITRKTSATIGNFWVDLVRTVVYILLPLSVLFAIVLVSEGVIQNFSSYAEVATMEGGKQTIPLGPAASQVAIKQLGTNGGGFFNANSAHPFENPTALTNFLESLAIIVLPAALVYTYGLMIGSKKHALVLFSVMLIFWASGLALSLYSESLPNPFLGEYPVLEGKETRFGNTNSILWSVSTTAAANGSVNAMMSSLSPLAGGVAMYNMMLGELIFGGAGVGMCSMIMFTLMTVFLAGLMAGRTPEYRGKKIEKREVQWVMSAILLPGALILIGTAISLLFPAGSSSLGNLGPHGLSEVLYAFASAAGNNGSAFAGLNANTTYYNLILGIVMLASRLAIIVPSLAIAGRLAAKKTAPFSAGTLSTNTPLFAILLIGVTFIVGALTFFPALSLGPVIEHFLMIEGRSF